MNILVCDDDKDIVGAIEIYLKNEGYQVYKAYDGLEALAVVEKEDIQLILMDIMMPKMDGMRATMRIREENNIPIIMLSAKSEDYDKITGLNMGADDYITKPFNPLELIARVKAVLRRYVTLSEPFTVTIQTELLHYLTVPHRYVKVKCSVLPFLILNLIKNKFQRPSEL